MEDRVTSRRERFGVALTVLGGLVLVVAGAWYLEVVSLPSLPSPGVVLTMLGVGQLLLGAYLFTRAERR